METAEMEKNQAILDQATAFKDSGNQHYAAEDYKAAMRCYHKCLLQARVLVQLPTQVRPRQQRSSLKRKSESETGEPEAVEESSEEPAPAEPPPFDDIAAAARQLLLNCYNNLAACILNGPPRDAETYLRAVDYCDKVLAKDAANAKALFRRARAFHKAGDFEKAIAAYDKAPKTTECAKLRKECQNSLDAERRARDAEIRRNFESAQRFAAVADAQPPAQHPPQLPNGHIPPNHEA